MLSLDPIGDFLERMRLEGVALPAPEQDVRERLEAFRREFPALPLPKLGSNQLTEYLAGEAAGGRAAKDLAVTREVAQRFLQWARSDPGTGSGLLRLQAERGLRDGEAARSRHENPYATSVSSGGDRIAPASRPAGGGATGNAAGALVILLLLAALGAAAYWYAGGS